MDLFIDDEFKNLLWPLTAEQYEALEKSIIGEGCRDALVVWGDIIVDGHNRYEICKKHGIEFRVEKKEFETRVEVLDWIDLNQIGRRNLTKDQFDEIIGRRYNRMKKNHGGQGSNRYVQSGQNEYFVPKTHQQIAKEHNVSPSTVQRAAKFAEAMEEIKTDNPELPREEVVKKAKQKVKTKRPKKEAIKKECISVDDRDKPFNKKELAFIEMFSRFLFEAKKAKETKWKQVRYEIVCRCAGDLNNQL